MKNNLQMSNEDYATKPFTSVDNNKDFGYLKYLENA